MRGIGGRASRPSLTPTSVPTQAAVLQEAEAAVERAASQIRRRLDTTGIRDSLYANFDHPRWDNVARRVGLNSSPTLRTGGAKSRI